MKKILFFIIAILFSINSKVTAFANTNIMEVDLVTDHILSLVSGLSYSNLKDYEGKKVNDAIKDEKINTGFLTIKSANFLKDAIIIHSNESGVVNEDDGGMGSVAIKLIENGEEVVIYSIRGTEFYDDNNDILTSGLIFAGTNTVQFNNAYEEYVSLCEKYNTVYITGHSLGGRISSDIVYSLYLQNEKSLYPKRLATFNALGYNRFQYMKMNFEKNLYKINNIIVVNNYYYESDFIGDYMGVSNIANRFGNNIKYVAKNYKGDNIKIKGDYNNYDYFTVHDIRLWHKDVTLMSLTV